MFISILYVVVWDKTTFGMTSIIHGKILGVLDKRKPDAVSLAIRNDAMVNTLYVLLVLWIYDILYTLLYIIALSTWSMNLWIYE
jgi:hypothetical protein